MYRAIRPTWRKQPFNAPDWLFDVKYDGFRRVCYVDRDRSCFIARNGNIVSRGNSRSAISWWPRSTS
jgi:ATP-dependent DNA ligase